MRLINPGIGEVSDRLSILALKRLFGEAAGKDCRHFVAEQATLLAQIRSRTLNASWFEAVLDLAAVNAALWHAEDDLRAYRGRQQDEVDKPTAIRLWMEVGQRAFRIQSLNDRRSELVAQINREAGDSVGEEKING